MDHGLSIQEGSFHYSCKSLMKEVELHCPLSPGNGTNTLSVNSYMPFDFYFHVGLILFFFISERGWPFESQEHSLRPPHADTFWPFWHLSYPLCVHQTIPAYLFYNNYFLLSSCSQNELILIRSNNGCEKGETRRLLVCTKYWSDLQFVWMSHADFPS